DINEVNSIIKMVPITRIPNAPAFVEGVINLRGRIIVVVDLAKKLGLQGKERDKDTRIIVVETSLNMVGMIVDHSREAIRVSEEQIEQAPGLITQKINSDFLEGVAIVPSGSKEEQQKNEQNNNRLLILLDLAKILNEEERESVQKTQESAENQKGHQEQSEGQEKSEDEQN
ncbi:MAG: chemotaxis protein CheW, partial [Nanoarchaeota archaeon]